MFSKILNALHEYIMRRRVQDFLCLLVVGVRLKNDEGGPLLPPPAVLGHTLSHACLQTHTQNVGMKCAITYTSPVPSAHRFSCQGHL